MRLKSLINALFRMSGGMAMPKTDFSETNTLPFTAPDNGWIVFNFKSQYDQYQWYLIFINGTPFFNNVGSQFIGGGSCACLPVKKGDIVSDTMAPDYPMAFIYLRFFKTMGGGINRLLLLAQTWIRGGAICLKASLKDFSAQCAHWSLLVQLTQTTKYLKCYKLQLLTMDGLCFLSQKRK